MSDNPEHKPIDKAIVLPSIWEPLRDTTLYQQLNDIADGSEESIRFDSLCSLEECRFREEIKNAFVEISNKYNLSAAERVLSVIPIAVEISIEHANINNFRSAAADFALLSTAFLRMLTSDSMYNLVTSSAAPERKDMEW